MPESGGIRGREQDPDGVPTQRKQTKKVMPSTMNAECVPFGHRLTSGRTNASVWIKRDECKRGVSFHKGSPPRWRFYEGLKMYAEERWNRYAYAYGFLPTYPFNDVTWDTDNNVIVHNSFEAYGDQPDY